MEEVKAYMYKGFALVAQKEWHQAALAFCQAIKINPNFPPAYEQLGEVLFFLEDWDNAQACFSKVVELDPEFAESYNYLGVVLRYKGLIEEAKYCYRKAIEKNPNYFEAFHNLGNCLKLTNDFQEAEGAYCRALELKPDFEEACFSLGTLYLLCGQYNKGWKLYDARLNWRRKFRLDIPIWQGEELAGRRILLFYEQGFGDMLQFIRYATKVAKVAKKTTVWIQKPLERLLVSAQNLFSVCTNTRKIDPREFDFACSIFSLPAKFQLGENMLTTQIPYIHSTDDIIKKWDKKIAKQAGNKVKVGFIWAGNPKHLDDHNRSIPFEVITTLFDNEAVCWVSLQIGKKAKELKKVRQEILDCGEELVDFAETAGVIANLDLVIAVDTAVAHLAGAMGKKTWLLLPHRGEWRWGLTEDSNPWYPATRIFRQHTPGDWQEVLTRVKIALQEWTT